MRRNIKLIISLSILACFFVLVIAVGYFYLQKHKKVEQDDKNQSIELPQNNKYKEAVISDPKEKMTVSEVINNKLAGISTTSDPILMPLVFKSYDDTELKNFFGDILFTYDCKNTHITSLGNLLFKIMGFNFYFRDLFEVKNLYVGSNNARIFEKVYFDIKEGKTLPIKLNNFDMTQLKTNLLAQSQKSNIAETSVDLLKAWIEMFLHKDDQCENFTLKLSDNNLNFINSFNLCMTGKGMYMSIFNFDLLELDKDVIKINIELENVIMNRPQFIFITSTSGVTDQIVERGVHLLKKDLLWHTHERYRLRGVICEDNFRICSSIHRNDKNQFIRFDYTSRTLDKFEKIDNIKIMVYEKIKVESPLIT